MVRGRLPRPVLVALGAASRVPGQVRRMPAALVQVPVAALTSYDRARRTYDALALRGEDVVAGLLGGDEAPAAAPKAPQPTDPVADAVAHVADPLDHPTAHRPDGPEPLPGYDAMTLGALRGHLRTLTAADLERVLTYERAYLARQPMLTLVEHRLAKLAVDAAGTE